MMLVQHLLGLPYEQLNRTSSFELSEATSGVIDNTTIGML